MGEQYRQYERLGTIQPLVLSQGNDQHNSRPIELWDIMAQVAKGVEFMHLHGETHRDLKPTNSKPPYVILMRQYFTVVKPKFGSLPILGLHLKGALKKPRSPQEREGLMGIGRRRFAVSVSRASSPIRSTSGR
jgi:hypothetical protein